jgi:hypothetical protein
VFGKSGRLRIVTAYIESMYPPRVTSV